MDVGASAIGRAIIIRNRFNGREHWHLQAFYSYYFVRMYYSISREA